jgi:hypothetical protein
LDKKSQYLTFNEDGRGSTKALTDETGAIVERFQYSYGLLLRGEASTTPFLFNGMYGVMTDASGRYYMRARYYSERRVGRVKRNPPFLVLFCFFRKAR